MILKIFDFSKFFVFLVKIYFAFCLSAIAETTASSKFEMSLERAFSISAPLGSDIFIKSKRFLIHSFACSLPMYFLAI